MASLTVTTIAIDKLVFDPSNARLHPDKNLDAIKGSLTKFGQQKPIVINKKNIVIAGNGTLAAAKALGWKEIQCTVTELDDLNQTAFAIADNRTSELAIWDQEALQKTLADLELNGFKFEDFGFDKIDFENLFDDSNKELSEDDFSSFGHQCPKCGFEFDDEA